MHKVGKIILLVLFSIIIAGGIGFLAYEIPRQGDSRKALARNKEKTDTSASALDEEYTDDPSTGYILIGDSRFVGMDLACDITDNVTNHQYVVAKVGEGYNWFINSALSQAEDIKKTHTWISKWKYVICLGVNDLWDLDKYKDEYLSLKNDYDLTLVSVGPTGPSAKVSNDDVTEFNNKLRDFCDRNSISYIDYNTVISREGFTTADGLHYTDAVYKRIYSIIEDGMKNNKVSPSTRSE